MTEYLLEMFGVSLGMTLLIELPVGFAMGMRGWKYVLLMLLVNVLTNPAAVFVCWHGVPQFPVETIVVAVEACVYYWFSTDDAWKIGHPVLLSVAANAVSWIGGILIQMGGLL